MSTPVTTNYSAQNEANMDTFQPGYSSEYRTLHWLKDIIANFMSDPINIKDERLCRLLNFQNGDKETNQNALFDIGTAYGTGTQKATTTPMLLISYCGTQYQVKPINQIGIGPFTTNGSVPMYRGMKYKTMSFKITITTETYDGNLLLSSFIQDFLLINENQFVRDNHSINEFHVLGMQEPQMVRCGEDVHAKTVFKTTIGLVIDGGLSWVTDTQGPVYRGLSIKVNTN